MSTSRRFDPNQKRDQAGKWEQQRGTRPPEGTLSASEKAHDAEQDAATPDPKHWDRYGYTPEQRQRLRDLKPLNWDEMGSSEKDMWEERTLAAFARVQARAARQGPSQG